MKTHGDGPRPLKKSGFETRISEAYENFEDYSEIFGIMGEDISLHYPFFYPINATILFRFTAIAVNIACNSTLFRPYPVARSNP